MFPVIDTRSIVKRHKNSLTNHQVTLPIRSSLDEMTTLEKPWDSKSTVKLETLQVWILLSYSSGKLKCLLILFLASSSLMDPTTDNLTLRSIRYFNRIKTFWTPDKREFQLLPTSQLLCSCNRKPFQMKVQYRWMQLSIRCLTWKILSLSGRILT